MRRLVRDFIDWVGNLAGRVTFRGEMPPWLMWVLIAAGVVIAVLFYRREAVRLSPARRNALIALRALVFAAIIILLRKPVIVSEKQSEKPRPVAVVVDNTQ